MSMNKKVIGVAVIGAALVGGVFTVSQAKYIDQGEVGVVWTAKDGVEDETWGTGLHFKAPLERVKKYQISQQQLVLSNNPEDYGDKKHADWHIDAPANGGMVKMNMTVNYNFIPDRVTDLYTKFNGMDGDEIVDSRVQGEADKAKAEADAAVKKINAEAKAEQTRISAEAEADANRVLNDSITDNLIRMKEAEARLKHGWVTVNGANTVVTEDGGENK